jgi:hypothetical protein
MKAKTGCISYPNTLDKVVKTYSELCVDVQALLDAKLPGDVRKCRFIKGPVNFEKNKGRGFQFTIITPNNVGYTGFSFFRPDDTFDPLLGEKKACRRAIKSMDLALNIAFKVFVSNFLKGE